MKNGIVKGYYLNGNLKSEYHYKDDEKHGLCKWYYSDGKLEYEHNYKDGKLHGICKGYYSDGKLQYEYNYIDGKRHGICKRYYLEFEYNKDVQLRSTLKSEIEKLVEDIYDVENNISEMDYYSKTDDILMDYYEILEKDNEDIYEDNPELCEEKNEDSEK